MSETKNTQENEAESNVSGDFSRISIEERLRNGTISYLIIIDNVDPLDSKALLEIFQKFEWQLNEDIIGKAIEDARKEAIAHDRKTLVITLPMTMKDASQPLTERWIDASIKLKNKTASDEGEELIFELKTSTPTSSYAAKTNPPTIAEASEFIGPSKYVFRTSDKNIKPIMGNVIPLDIDYAKAADKTKKSLFTIIHLRINEEPLTPQTLALTFTALTELATKLWLIAKHRFADLVEYTQTHDIRFANEAGSTIAYVRYNSPFSFGFQVDKLVPGVAEGVMTVVDGVSQRKAKAEKLEIDNQAAAQKIKEAEEQLKQQQEMAELEREKREIELEKLKLDNQKIKQDIIEQGLESRIKQFEYAVELGGKTVDIVYPNADPEMRPILIQTIVNNILQLDSVEGLQIQLALPSPQSDNPATTEDTVQ